MTTINVPIAAGGDDGQAGSGAGFNTTGAITLGGYFGTANGWFRFVNVTIPQGSTITAATLTAERRATASGQADLIFYANKVANASNPSSDSDYNAKAVTTANVTHNNQTGGSGTYTSPSLVSIIQEITDQGSWASGNALMILIKDNNSNSTHGGFENRITFKPYDEGSTLPTLNVTYTPPATKITSTFASVVATSSALATNTRKQTQTSTVATATSTSLATNTRKQSHTVAVSVGMSNPPRFYIYFPGWLGVGGTFTLESFGENIGPVTWSDTGSTLVSNLQAAVNATSIAGGGLVVVSLVSAVEPVAVEILYKTGPGFLNTSTTIPTWSVVTTTGSAPDPEFAVINEGGKSYINVKRYATETISATTTTGDALLGAYVGITSTFAATTSTGVATLATYLKPTSTFAAVVALNTPDPEFRRKVASTLDVVVDTSTADGRTDRFAPVQTIAATVATSDALLGKFIAVSQTFSAATATSTASVVVTKKLLATIPAGITTGDAVLGTKIFISNTWAASLVTSSATSVIFCRLYSTWQTITEVAAEIQFKHLFEAHVAAEVATSSAQIGNVRKAAHTISASVLPAGNVSTYRPFTSTFAGVLVVTGILRNPVNPEQEIETSVQTGSASASVTRKLSSTFTVSIQTPAARLNFPLSSTFAVETSSTGNAIIRKKLLSSFTVSVNPEALATVTRQVSSTIRAEINAAATTINRLKIVSTFAAAITITGRETPRRKIASTVAVVIASGSALATNTRKQLQTTSVSTSTASAAIVNTRKLTATIQNVVVVQAVPTITRKLSQAIEPNLSTVAACGVSRLVVSTFAVALSTSGVVSLDRKLRSTFEASIVAAGLVDVERNLSTRISAATNTGDNRPNFNDFDARECWQLPPRSTVWVLPDSTFLEEGF